MGGDPGRLRWMIAVLGAGQMGEALLSGLLRSGVVAPGGVVASGAPQRPRRAAARLLRDRGADRRRGGSARGDPRDQRQAAGHGGAAGRDLRLVSEDKLVISIAAGIPTSFIERRLTGDVPVVRVMSNTPALVDEAMSVISPGSHATQAHLQRTEELLRPVGKVLQIPRVSAGRGDRAVWQRAGLRVLPRGGDGRRRDPARHAAGDRAGDGQAGRVRRGDHAARLRRAPGAAAGGGDLDRAGRRSTRSGNWRSTASGPRSWRRSSRRGTGAASSPAADAALSQRLTPP